MGKKAIIAICLVDESVHTSNREIGNEICEEILEIPRIPWLAKVEKVTIVEDKNA